MKRLGIFAGMCLLLATSLSALAEGSGPTVMPTEDVAAVQAGEQPESLSAAGNSCWNSQSVVEQVATGADDTGGTRATCTARCHDGSTVSCTASSCSAQDANCPSNNGWVRCNGRTTSCGSCPAPNDPCPVNSCNYVFDPVNYCCNSATCFQICW